MKERALRARRKPSGDPEEGLMDVEVQPGWSALKPRALSTVSTRHWRYHKVWPALLLKQPTMNAQMETFPEACAVNVISGGKPDSCKISSSFHPMQSPSKTGFSPHGCAVHNVVGEISLGHVGPGFLCCQVVESMGVGTKSNHGTVGDIAIICSKAKVLR